MTLNTSITSALNLLYSNDVILILSAFLDKSSQIVLWQVDLLSDEHSPKLWHLSYTVVSKLVSGFLNVLWSVFYKGPETCLCPCKWSSKYHIKYLICSCYFFGSYMFTEQKLTVNHYTQVLFLLYLLNYSFLIIWCHNIICCIFLSLKMEVFTFWYIIYTTQSLLRITFLTSDILFILSPYIIKLLLKVNRCSGLIKV